MTPNLAALVVLPLVVAGSITGALGYLTRYRPPRPPIGVYRWSDIAFMLVSVVLAPFAYLALPRIVVAVLFGLVVGSAVQMTLSPVCGPRRATVAALAPVAFTGGAALAGQPALVTTGTDITLLLAMVGVTNLWIQSGMRAAHVAALAAGLMVYDLVATGLTDVTIRFAREMRGLPFAPVFALTGGSAAVSIGLGDLLMLVLYPLAAARSYGRRPALIAGATGVLTVSTIDLCFGLGLITTAVPFLTALGPLILAQQLYWRRAYPRERSVRQWLKGFSAAEVQETQPSVRSDALRLTGPWGGTSGEWVAIVDDQVVGRGATPGRARRSAREQGCLRVPVVRQA